MWVLLFLLCVVGIFISFIALVRGRMPMLKIHNRKNALAALLLSFVMMVVVAVAMPIDPPEDVATEPNDAIETLTEQTSTDAEVSTLEEQGEPSGSVTVTPSGELVAHFIDVGQGDAILIEAPGYAALIDGGPGAAGQAVCGYIKEQGIKSIDLVIATHPHEDHIGGLVDVLKEFPVKEVIDPAVIHTTKTYEDFLTIIDERDIKFTEGRADLTRDLGGTATLQILHPGSPSSSDLNNASIVTRIFFGKTSFLFTGDAESAAENEIIGRGYDLNSTILKVGHHGSKTSTTQAFLTAVDPQVAVVMCGDGNSYGHPHAETLAKLHDSKTDIYRTDTQGAIVIKTDGHSFTVNVKPYQYTQQKVPEETPDTEKAAVEAPKAETSQDDITVYITNSGSKYHTSGCRHLSKSKIPISLSDAKARGYSPCGTCRPPS